MNFCYFIITLDTILSNPFQGGASFVGLLLFLSLSHCLNCSLQPCCHLLGKVDFLALLCVMLSCVFVSFPYGVLDQMWYLTVLIPDFFLISYCSYLYHNPKNNTIS